MKIHNNSNRKYLKPLLAVIFLSLIGILALAVLILTKTIRPNLLPAAAYPINGVDVSAYQGEIDWEKLASQNIQFAYIKATEGSSFTDSCFHENWDAAWQTDLRVGAYHFFSYDSPGSTQAAHFIETIDDRPDMLPPAVDVEFYGDKEKNPPEKEDVERELEILLNALEDAYGKRPVIYATEKSYRLYISGVFDEYDIWIRNVYTPPLMPRGREWTFWQYTDTARLEGYSGEEPCIDRNVFCGTAEEFVLYGGTAAD